MITFPASRLASGRLASTFAVLLCALSLGGCILVVDDPGEDDCFGRPELLYAIDDVTLVLDEEILEFDLEGPPIFDHTGREYLRYEATSSSRSVAYAYVHEGFLVVEPRGVGTARIEVRARDRCNSRASTSFRVRVIR